MAGYYQASLGLRDLQAGVQVRLNCGVRPRTFPAHYNFTDSALPHTAFYTCQLPQIGQTRMTTHVAEIRDFLIRIVHILPRIIIIATTKTISHYIRIIMLSSMTTIRNTNLRY